MNKILIPLVCFVFLGVLSGSGSATTPISSCTTITSPGVYELTQDLSNSSTCITIESSDVAFDGQGYTITGPGSSGNGIYVYNDSTTLTNVTVKNVTVTGWYYGIYYYNVSNGSIMGNNANSNGGYYSGGGIHLSYSSNYNTLTNNTASNNYNGILLDSSSDNTLSGNTMSANTRYNFYIRGEYVQTIDTTNTVDGKPVYYLVSVSDQVIDSSTNAGFVGVINSVNVTVKDLTLTKSGQGMLFANTTDSFIFNVTTSNNDYGINLYSSSNNTITGNTASNSRGIYLDESSSNTLEGNTANSNYRGIHLESSNSNTITGNTASNNGYGIFLSSSSNNTIINNNANSNWVYGIYLDYSSNNNVTDNIVNSNDNKAGAGAGIYLYSSSNNIVTGNTANSNNNKDGAGAGIYLYSSSNYNTLKDNTASNNDDGISVFHSSYNTITGNTANSNNKHGIRVFHSSNRNTITGNIASNNYGGIYLDSSSNNIVTGNTANANHYGNGIVLGSSSGNTITDNTASNNKWGIYLSRSSGNTLTNNTAMENNYYDVYVLATSDAYCNNIIENNTGSGDRPIKYFNYSVSLQDEILSELILCNADNSNIDNVTIEGSATKDNNGLLVIRTDNSNFTNINSSNNYDGIYLYFSSNNDLTNNTINLNKGYGIYLDSSSSNTITGNTANANGWTGIYLYSSSKYNTITGNNASSNNNYGIRGYSSWYNNITNNNIALNNKWGISLRSYTYGSDSNTLTNNTANSNNVYGIYLDGSSYNTLTSNNASNNRYGIYLSSSIYLSSFSNYNTLTNNTASSNTRYGIYLRSSSSNTFTNNVINDSATSGFYFSGTDSYYNTIKDNRVNGNIYYHLVNKDSIVLENKVLTAEKPSNLGWVSVINSTNVILRNLTLANNTGYSGLFLYQTNGSSITNVTSYSNYNGILLSSSDNNYIVSNNIINNTNYGVSISSSSSNYIHHNNFIENRYESVQARDDSTKNHWFIPREGNYWSDYTTRYPSATNDSIIWDTPYVIDGSAGAVDNYPLVHPVVAPQTFITGITPKYGSKITTINVTIYGSNFVEGMNVSLVKEGEEDIEGEDTVVLSEYQLTTRFNLTGRTTGLWDLVARLSDGEEIRLTGAFEIRDFVYGIFPDYGYNGTLARHVTVYGSGFRDGLVVKLTKEGEEDIAGEDIEVFSKTGFTTKFNLTGRAVGLWDVVTTLPDGEQATLPGAFEILGTSGAGYLIENITITAGESQEYGIEVPETNNLFIRLQKTSLVSYGNGWNGKLSLLREGIENASVSGSHDNILHIVDPEPGFYTVKVTAYQTGSGIVTVGTSLPELPLGGWVVDTIYTSYGSVWYQVEVPPDQDTLYFEAEGMGLWSHFDIYYGEYGSSNHWVSPQARDDRRTSIEIPNPAPGTYIVEFMDSAMVGYSGGQWSEDQTRDILVKADTTFSAEPPPDYLPAINSISPDRGGNTGLVTVEVKGVWLDQNATISLVRSGYEDIVAQNVYGSSDGTTLSATFNLVDKEPGEWSLVVTNPNGRNATATQSFTIEEGGKAELSVEIIGREVIRAGRPAKYILRYENTGDVDMPAPLSAVSTSNTSHDVSLRLPGKGYEDTIKVFSKGSPGSPDVLRPGSSYEIPFNVYTGSEDNFDLRVSTTRSDPIFEVRNIANFLDASSPAPGIPLAFTRVFSQVPINSSDIGPLGYGWTNSYDIRLKEFSDGTVALLWGSSYSSFFLDNGDGTYTALRGHDTLTRNPDDTFQLKQRDGTIYGFLTDLRFDYIEDTNGNRIDAVYNPDNQLIELQHSSGGNFSLEYNEHGRISRLIDHAGRVTEYRYDESGERLMNVTTPDGAVTNYSYTASGGNLGLSSISYPGGIRQFFEYDGEGRLFESYLNGKEESIRYSYDVANKATYVTDAYGNTTTVHVDEFGQIMRSENPLGAVTRYEYDGDSNLLRTTDSLGKTSDFSYDKKGNVIKVTDPLNHEITMDYNQSFNKLTWLKDARGNEITFDYDDHGNLLNITYPDTSTESMDYDAAGNPIKVTTRKGDAINYTYNGRGQLIRKDYPDGSWVAYEYDDAGNMISASDENGTIEMEYDIRNLLTHIKYPTGYYFNYSYDDAGRLIQRVDQEGNALNYEYDTASRLVRISDESDSDIVRYEYDKQGRFSKKTLGSGAYTTYEYDATGQILHLINYNGSSNIISRFDYTYDLMGNPISMNTLEGNYSYEYDSIGQLSRVTYPDGYHVSYSYDATGNRIAVVDDGKATNYTTNNMNQYTEVGNVSYIYDANGNMISKTENGQDTTYEYNFENRLVRVTSSEGTWEYNYDALGNRVGVIHNGTEHRYLVEPQGFGNVVAEYDGNGSLIARYNHGFGLISKIDSSGNPYYYHFNPTGHTMEITDENGDVVNRYKYSPFGKYLEKEETIPNPFGYVGEFGVMDDGNGLNYMRMRYYQPDLGRFSTEDTFRIPGVNGYSYTQNNPIGFIDPLGLYSFRQLLQDWSISFGIAGTAAMFVPGGQLAGTVLLGISAASTGLEISLYSENPIADTVKAGSSMFLGSRMPGGYDLLLDPAIHLIETGFDWLSNEWFSRPTPLVPSLQEETPIDEIHIQSVSSTTPEDKYGPTGYDLPDTPPEERMRFIPADQKLYYKIDFWNKENATAPACDVYVNDQLDTKLNWSTFRFKEIGFLNWTVELEPSQYFNLNVDPRPEMDVIVNVEGIFNPDNGAINWTFRCLDPTTYETPEDPMAGFLPPITESGYEIGWADFSVDHDTDLPTGTQIENQAFVNFDGVGPFNPAPKEGPFTNTIDAGPPASNITATLLDGNTIQLNWTGQDDLNGSGIKDYTIYVSENGAIYSPLLVNTINNSAVFAGESGHTYAFYSMARDNVGNIEEAPEEPDAVVYTGIEPVANFTFTPENPFVNEEITFNATSSYDPDGQIVSYEWDFGDGNITNTTTPIIAHSYQLAGDYNVTLMVTDNSSDTNSTSKLIQVTTANTTTPGHVNTTVIQRLDYYFNVTWTTPPDPDLKEFNIYQRQNDNVSTDALIDTVPANYMQPYIAGPGTDDGNFYQYMVTAVDESDNEGNGTYAPIGGPVPPIPFAPFGTLLTLGSGLAAYGYYRRKMG